jgi:hypothetical protein
MYKIKAALVASHQKAVTKQEPASNEVKSTLTQTKPELSIELWLELWFKELYELYNETKSYILSQTITQNSDLTPEQAMRLLKDIMAIDQIRIKAVRASAYLKNEPQIKPDSLRDTIKGLGEAFKIIDDQLCNPYEHKARAVVQRYAEEQKQQRKTLNYDGRPAKIPQDKMMLINQLADPKPMILNTEYRKQIAWKKLKNIYVEKHRKRCLLWNDTLERMELYYKSVNREVKIRVDKVIKDEHDALIKLHESRLKTLDLHESAIKDSEESMRYLFSSIDMAEQQKDQTLRQLLRIGITVGIAPWMFFLIDPLMMSMGGVIQRMALNKTELEVQIVQQNLIYQMTGLFPEFVHTSYAEACRKLSNESYYDSIGRNKKFLEHKINPISPIKRLTEIMSENSRYWAEFTVDKILDALRMQIMNEAHYKHPGNKLTQPEHKDSLVNAMVKPLEAMVKELFKPLKEQYGNKSALECMQTIIERINFNETVAGSASHNQYKNSELVKSMSNEAQIHFLVKHLVQSMKYFGCTTFNQQLHHDHVTFKDNDYELGSYPDDGPCRTLVKALLTRIAQSYNHSLKEKLGLNRSGDIMTLVDNHPLTAHFITNMATGVLHHYTNKEVNHFLQRRAMIRAIIQEYFQPDLHARMQNIVIDYAKKHRIYPDEQIAKAEDLNKTKPNWLSDNETEALIAKSLSPLIEQVRTHQKVNGYIASTSHNHFVNEKLYTEATVEKAYEEEEKKLEASGNIKKITF